MPAASGAGALPTRWQIENWDVEHLEAAATHWTSTAQTWEEHFTAIHQGTLSLGGTVWKGDAAEAAQERTWSDLVKVRGAVDALYSAARYAREGAGDLAWAKRQALDPITEAEEAQFMVVQDLSASDPTTTMLMRGWEVRQAQAQEFAAEIASRARTLAAVDQEVAGRITAALAPLRRVTFAEASPPMDSPVTIALATHDIPQSRIVLCTPGPRGGPWGFHCEVLYPSGHFDTYYSNDDESGGWP